ncbi:DUF3857 domain-containing protein [Blastomonas fulva]|uniref:DUF3857 domain-containing protein n=1 Tax=Blastomonas fulva TaxID=1550728 RepID=UPI003F72772E
MRNSVFVGCVLLASAQPALAQKDQVKRGPEPDWVRQSELAAVPEDAAGAVFVRRQDVWVHLDTKGQQQYLGYRIKLLHSNALQLGNLAISWNPQAGAPVVHTIKVHRNGEVIDALKSGTFEILRREDQLEAASLDGVLTAVLRVADLRVGDELEFATTIPVADPTLGSATSGLLTLAPSLPSGRYRMGLSWIDGQEPRISMTKDFKAVARISESGVELDFDDPPVMTEIKDAPWRYQWQRVLEFSDYPDWNAISQHFAPLYAAAAKLPADSPIRQEAARIAAAHASPGDRAQAALRLVQKDVRYIYVGLDGGNLTPATAEETWKRRYGDCKGKTALLLALLNELGIQAEPVLANNTGLDDGIDQRLPSPGLFDHVLVRATIGDEQLYLDGTLPDVIAAGTQPFLPYRWVLPLTTAGASIEPLAWKPANRPQEISLYEIDATEGFDAPAQIHNTIITRGLDGLKQHFQYSAIAPAQLQAALSQQLVGETWQSIDKVAWRYDRKAQASILTISGKGMVDWRNDGDGARSTPLPGGGFNPPDRRIRPAGQDQSLPYANSPGYTCHVTTVRLPKTASEKHWSFKSGFDTRIFGRNYYRVFGIGDGAIRMIRSSRTERIEIDAETARTDNDRIAKFDNSMGYVFYDPAGVDMPPSRAKPVPATYDIDWTADNVPCLPADTAP